MKLLRLSFFLFIQFGAEGQSWILTSSDHETRMYVTLSPTGQLTYQVKRDGETLILPSPLGLVVDGKKVSSGLKFKGRSDRTADDQYQLIAGKQLNIKYQSKETALSFTGADEIQLDLIVRIANGGVGFRYRLTGGGSTTHKIDKELTGFSIPDSSIAWVQPYDLNERLKPCYETYYEQVILPGARSPNQAGWAFPVLYRIKESNKWVLLTEAGLSDSYCGTHLTDSTVFTIRFPEKEEVTSSAAPEPVSTFPWTTPWRAIIIGNSAADVYASTLITDLNEPSVIKDVSWIKPGRSSWSWWSAGSSPRDFNTQKDYVDFTARMGWEYVLIDSGWPQMKNGSIEDLINYANSKNVGIVLWYHSGLGREKDTLSTANVMAFAEARRKEFEKLQAWGVKGVKVDFFDSDKQPVIQRYIDILKVAAEYKITVNFHGSTLPRGWERTYPHLVSMESVKGAEWYGRQEFCDRAPVHNTVLPFTRNVVGPMDYTPLTFTHKREAMRKTTFAHELALSVVFQSGVVHFADCIESYESLPAAPLAFIKGVPADWDESRILAGEPGEYVVVARRKGPQWYIAGINSTEDRTVKFKLPANLAGKNMPVITDGPTYGTFSEVVVNPNGAQVSLRLLPNGGFVSIMK